MINNIDPNGVITIKQEGFYYSVKNNDALILNKYLGYKIYGVNQFRTGFPVKALNSVLKKIDKLNMNYDVINRRGILIASKRFPNNIYEIIDAAYPITGTKSGHPEPQKQIKLKYKDRLTKYINVLIGLSEGCNILTGEVIKDFDKDLQEICFEMAKYFDERLKIRNKRDEEMPNSGRKWTKEDDDKLLHEVANGKTIEEMSELFKRSCGAIKSRLISLLNIFHEK